MAGLRGGLRSVLIRHSCYKKCIINKHVTRCGIQRRSLPDTDVVMNCTRLEVVVLPRLRKQACLEF